MSKHGGGAGDGVSGGRTTTGDSLMILRFEHLPSSLMDARITGALGGPLLPPACVPVISISALPPPPPEPLQSPAQLAPLAPQASPPQQQQRQTATAFRVGGAVTIRAPVLASQLSGLADVLYRSNGSGHSIPTSAAAATLASAAALLRPCRTAVGEVPWLRPQLEACLKRLVPLLRWDPDATTDAAAGAAEDKGAPRGGATRGAGQGSGSEGGDKVPSSYASAPLHLPRSGGLLVTGAAGSGKSALLAAAQDLLTCRGGGGRAGGRAGGVGGRDGDGRSGSCMSPPVHCLHVSCSKLVAAERAAVEGGSSGGRGRAATLLSELVSEALRCQPCLLVLDDVELLVPSGEGGGSGAGGEDSDPRGTEAAAALALWLAEVWRGDLEACILDTLLALPVVPPPPALSAPLRGPNPSLPY